MACPKSVKNCPDRISSASVSQTKIKSSGVVTQTTTTINGIKYIVKPKR
jgi:hypothetical protein